MSFDLASIQHLGLDGLHFLRPAWLWLLLALPLLAWWWRRRQVRKSVWRNAVDPHLLTHLLQGRTGVRGQGALWLGLLTAALGICALAGPSWQRVEQPLWQSRAPLVIALDLSRTITASDLPPSRLAQARAKIAALLQKRAGGQVGLVAFADDAYTVAPLTDDAGNVALFLDALTPDIMPSDSLPPDSLPSDDTFADKLSGSASHAGRAIEWSAGLLRQAGFDQGDILLLTDHASSGARDAAAKAKGDGYRVSVLGLGNDKGAAYRDADGRIAQTRLDAGSLRALANAGGGSYATSTPDGGDLAAIGVLDPQQVDAQAAHGEKTSVWRDQGYWLLLPLLLLAAFAFRRGGALAALLLCLWLPLGPVHAADGTPASPKPADGTLWRRADQQQHKQLLQGAQAYGDKDYAAAVKTWKGLPGSDAAYNRGNALARQGEYDAAIAQYDQALKLQSGMEDAIANKKAVEAAKKRKQPKGKQQGQQQKQDGNQKDDQKKTDGQQKGQDGQESKDKPSGDRKQDEPNPDDKKTPSQTGQTDQTKPDEPVDADAQRKADAAQRERMQQALQKAGQEKKQEQAQAQAAKPDETPAERERRIANEAWLRRVPDDPGGLLRARFRLEYLRRQQGDR